MSKKRSDRKRGSAAPVTIRRDPPRLVQGDSPRRVPRYNGPSVLDLRKPDLFNPTKYRDLAKAVVQTPQLTPVEHIRPNPLIPVTSEGDRRKGTNLTLASLPPEHDKRHSTELRDGSTCKPRPTKTKGNGSSRAFVPWCDRKR